MDTCYRKLIWNLNGKDRKDEILNMKKIYKVKFKILKSKYKFRFCILSATSIQTYFKRRAQFNCEWSTTLVSSKVSGHIKEEPSRIRPRGEEHLVEITSANHSSASGFFSFFRLKKYKRNI